jgi:hypothetical protein
VAGASVIIGARDPRQVSGGAHTRLIQLHVLQRNGILDLQFRQTEM